MSDPLEQTKALGSDVRLRILDWLRRPDAHFSHQATGKPSEIGVCVTLLTEKLEMAQPTVSRHLEILRRAEFLVVNKVGRWSFFSRNETAIADYKAWINDTV